MCLWVKTSKVDGKTKEEARHILETTESIPAPMPSSFLKKTDLD